MDEIVNTNQLAMILDVTPRTIQRLTREGYLKTVRRGKYNVYQAINQFKNYRLSLKKKKDEAYENAKARYLQLKNQMLELEYEKMKSGLIEVSEAREIANKIYDLSMIRLLRIASDVAPKIVGIDSIRKIKSILDEEIRLVLTELSRMKNV